MKINKMLIMSVLLVQPLLMACNPQSEPSQRLGQFTNSTFSTSENTDPKQINQIRFVMDVDENTASIQGLLGSGLFRPSDQGG